MVISNFQELVLIIGKVKKSKISVMYAIKTLVVLKYEDITKVID